MRLDCSRPDCSSVQHSIKNPPRTHADRANTARSDLRGLRHQVPKMRKRQESVLHQKFLHRLSSPKTRRRMAASSLPTVLVGQSPFGASFVQRTSVGPSMLSGFDLAE